MYRLQNITNNTCYSCVYKKELSKIKIDKIIFKIDYLKIKIKWISYSTN